MRGAVSADHLPLLVSAPPQIAPSKLVQYLKGRSSRQLQEEFPSLRQRCWGPHLWARGYCCATVGAVDEETIKRYIEEQRWDDAGEGQFRIVTGEPKTWSRLLSRRLSSGFSCKRTFSPPQTYQL